MGQSGKSANESPVESSDRAKLSIFATELGWIGILGCGEQLHWLSVGHASSDKVRHDIHDRLCRMAPDGQCVEFPQERDWFPSLRKRLVRYCSGTPAEFADVDLQLPEQTPFQRKVFAQTRKIPYGSAVSYGELALRSGYPNAARAVGTVMSTNRFPIVVPCHRVVQAGGKIGNYTSPQGTGLKKRLLAMEAAAS